MLYTVYLLMSEDRDNIKSMINTFKEQNIV